jgi:uncharacterized FlgJ-related protein
MKTSCCHTKKIRKENGLVVCQNEECDNYMRPSAILTPSKTWNNIFALFFFVFFFILSFDDYSFNGAAPENISRVARKTETIAPLNEENLRKELDENHVICPEQVFAQILIESGHLNSYLSKKANNLLGMRYPFRRKTCAIGIFLPDSNMIIKGTQAELKKYHNRNHYAVYANWEECVRDYKLWQDENFKLTERYLTFLGKYYAEDTQYIAKIKSLSK